MKAKNDITMTDLMRFIDTQILDSDDDAGTFMKNLIGRENPSLPKGVLSKKEQAQDLVFEAYALDPEDAKDNIYEALDLDPDCIDAYKFLGMTEESDALSMVFLEKGISIGRKIFNKKYMDENKGNFEKLLDARSFMSCLNLYSDALCVQGKFEEGIAGFEELIELDPSDNQRILDQLMLYYVHIGEFEKYLKYDEKYKAYKSHSAYFNDALYAFKTEGESKTANAKLAKAVKANKYIVKRFLANKLPREIEDFLTTGLDGEACMYVDYAYEIWKSTKGARAWLRKMTPKKK